ncbi:DUF305 domain-containing protein [Streptomyces sp. NPDC018610]|uniref:DUF305 domain-containing protein n=1 Tax=Streptomyces sp. NPDC018610 TaxID=3365049 RepID=UPI0037B55270
MHISSLRRGGVLLLALGAFVCAPTAAAVAVTAPSPSSTARAQGCPAGSTAASQAARAFGDSLAKLQGKQLEVAFLAGIVRQHQAAVEMAQRELQRGTDRDLRARAQDIVSGQKSQMEQFTRWLSQWYGMTPDQAMARLPAEVRQQVQGLADEARRTLGMLDRTGQGPGFDTMFACMMVPQHSSGVLEFLQTQARADHAELRTAAATGTMTQMKQITDFLAWLSGRAGSLDVRPSVQATSTRPGAVPEGAADTGDGATQGSTAPLIAAGCALAAAGTGVGAVVLRRRRGAGER